MSVEQQDFDELKRLLALKRQVQPSRNFFTRMSENIHEALQHPPPAERLTWWERLRADIDLKACAVGVLVCGLMLYAMLSAMNQKPTIVITIPADEKNKIRPPSVVVVKSAPTLQPIARAEEIPPSTAPVIAVGDTNVTAPPRSDKGWR